MYCVIKNTITVISNDTHNNLEIYYQDALSAGFESEQVEILTQKQYDERKVLEPIPDPQKTLEEKLAEKDEQILKLKEEQFMTQKMTIQNSETQQELIELLMDMGVI